ncbi:MAG: class I SAM-dependent methyltransferase [Nitrospirota bacterium]|nr:MAG: class I SAM-dependent methyltransferase [Nitrospirota bacterium]
MSIPTGDIEGLKARLKSTWMAGDFGEIAKSIKSHAEEFIERRSIERGMRVLDVACGTGNTAIPAAKAGANVTGVDIATNLLEQGRIRASGEGVNIQFDEGDAEALPYPDSSFDLVVSMYGAMFAPRAERVAAELVRVCRPGGEIAMANWTPDGFVGQMFKVTSAHVPPPPGMPSPVLWGDEATVRQRMASGIAELQLTPIRVSFRYPFSTSETIEFYRIYFGPTQRAFAALPEDKQSALRRDLEDHWAKHNRATDGTTDVEAEYLEVLARRA